jgi:phosphoribosylanthranilate isomerase
MISRVKICGITRLQDAKSAIEAGASALGFVFYAPSPRYVDPLKAQEIISKLPPFITTTALFVNETAENVNAISELIQTDLLQFHGDESNAYCRQFNRPFIKALRGNADVDITQAYADYPNARALLVDTFVKGVPGGTGAAFNWPLIPEALRQHIILAGGLDPGNVASAIRQIRPYAVDVSGGLEAEKGLKCAAKIIKFMSEVNNANQS